MTDLSAPDARASLLALAEEAWDGSMAEHPLYATALGDQRFLADLGPNDIDAPARERARLSGLLARAKEIPEAPLDEATRITRSALVDFLRFELDLVESGVERWIIDPLDGPQVQFLNVESYQPVATEAQGRAAVERWRAMGPWIDRHTERLRESLADGFVASQSLVDSVLDELEELLEQPDGEWPLLKPVAAPHPDWSPGARGAFGECLVEAVRDGIRPAFRHMREVLATEILPQARPDERPGLCHMPEGEAAYAHLVRAHTTLDLDPTVIHRTGLGEVARIDAEFAELGGRLLETSSTAATLERLRSDPALRFTTSDEVLATAEKALSRANAAIPGWFGRLPVAPCEIVVMGPHESKHSTIAYYRQPAADGSRPGRYYLNTTLPQTRPRYEAEALAFHESVPGHHLQLAIAQELDGLPAFRRFGGATAFIEGWGLYTERLSDEMGLYSGEVDRFGILSFDAWRACRLVVDTGLHAMGWTRGEAIAFMIEHTALAENNIVNEVDRYIALPGQALAYKVGQLELLRLRAQAEAALSGDFDIRAFHDRVLGEGAIGLETLRSVIAAWIEPKAHGRETS
jgi:uncharacterized protein (DUF885 family)